MIKDIFIILLLVPPLILGCGSDKNSASDAPPAKGNGVPTLPIPTDSFLINQVKTNLKGLNNEDLAWAMEPLHMNSPFMQEPEYHIRGSFLVYEMHFDLVSVDIESKSDTACVAQVIHDSRNDNERDYQPVRSVQRYTWKPDGDEWKIWKMEIVGTTPL